MANKVEYSWKALGDANTYSILETTDKGTNWLANIRLNGEMCVREQVEVIQTMVDSLSRPVESRHRRLRRLTHAITRWGDALVEHSWIGNRRPEEYNAIIENMKQAKKHLNKTKKECIV